MMSESADKVQSTAHALYANERTSMGSPKIEDFRGYKTDQNAFILCRKRQRLSKLGL